MQQKLTNFLAQYPKDTIKKNMDELILSLVTSQNFSDQSEKAKSELYLFVIDLKKLLKPTE